MLGAKELLVSLVEVSEEKPRDAQIPSDRKKTVRLRVVRMRKNKGLVQKVDRHGEVLYTHG